MEIRIQLLSFRSEQPSFDADPGRAKAFNADASGERMRIVGGDHDARNA